MTIALLTMGGLGLLFAAFLAIADKFLSVEENPLIAQINEVLPSANCGACAKAGCYAFAEAVVNGESQPDGCPVGGSDTAEEVAKLMGLEVSTAEKNYPVVMCQGTYENAYKKPVDYAGPTTCVALDIVGGGDLLCSYGCLGGADCVVACPFEALIMGDDGLPQVIKSLCTGCGICEEACPRDVIEMHPESHKVYVLCKNEDDAKYSKSVCKVACTGCTACGRKSEGSIVFPNNLAIVDYEKLDPAKVAFDKCPQDCIFNFEDYEN